MRRKFIAGSLAAITWNFSVPIYNPGGVKHNKRKVLHCDNPSSSPPSLEGKLWHKAYWKIASTPLNANFKGVYYKTLLCQNLPSIVHGA